MNSNKKKRFLMDDLMVSLDNDTKSDIEKNTEKLDELVQQIKILNSLITKLIERDNISSDTSYIS